MSSELPSDFFERIQGVKNLQKKHILFGLKKVDLFFPMKLNSHHYVLRDGLLKIHFLHHNNLENYFTTIGIILAVLSALSA